MGSRCHLAVIKWLIGLSCDWLLHDWQVCKKKEAVGSMSARRGSLLSPTNCTHCFRLSQVAFSMGDPLPSSSFFFCSQCALQPLFQGCGKQEERLGKKSKGNGTRMIKKKKKKKSYGLKLGAMTYRWQTAAQDSVGIMGKGSWHPNEIRGRMQPNSFVIHVWLCQLERGKHSLKHSHTKIRFLGGASMLC